MSSAISLGDLAQISAETRVEVTAGPRPRLLGNPKPDPKSNPNPNPNLTLTLTLTLTPNPILTRSGRLLRHRRRDAGDAGGDRGPLVG